MVIRARSKTERARRSSLVMTIWSPSRMQLRATRNASRYWRLAPIFFSSKIRSQPARRASSAASDRFPPFLGSMSTQTIPEMAPVITARLAFGLLSNQAVTSASLGIRCWSICRGTIGRLIPYAAATTAQPRLRQPSAAWRLGTVIGQDIVMLAHLSSACRTAELWIHRLSAQQRHNLFSDTPAGAHASAKFYSIIETCKAAGPSPSHTCVTSSRNCRRRRRWPTSRCCCPGTSLPPR